MNTRIQIFAGVCAWMIGCAPVMAAEQSDANPGEGAVVGASTQVLGDAAADALASPEVKNQSWWTTIKRALTGAVTGAVAAKTSGGNGDSVESRADDASDGNSDMVNAAGTSEMAIKKEHDQNLSHRPPGWDKGKKTGWGDGNLPPGLAKKKHD